MPLYSQTLLTNITRKLYFTDKLYSQTLFNDSFHGKVPVYGNHLMTQSTGKSLWNDIIDFRECHATVIFRECHANVNLKCERKM